jgi:Uma2 family endonuclease
MASAVLERPTGVETKSRNSIKLWTREQYRQLIANGFLQDGKVELINGEIWEKMGQGRRHTLVVTRIFKLLGLIFGFDRIQSQSSLPVAEYGDPEPDAALLAKDLDQYLETDPTIEEMLLVVEASDSTLSGDLTDKVLQYGSAGIPEYWVVDIPNRLLHVFRLPTEAGYAEETILNSDEEVRPLAAPDTAIRIADLLP